MTGADRKKLEWRCRRGTKELDALMTAYLGKRYDQADIEDQRLFQRLTDMPDPDLYDLLIGRALHADEAINRLAETIRATSHLS